MQKLEKQGRAQEDQKWANSFDMDAPFCTKRAHDLRRDPYYRKLTFGISLILWVVTAALSFLLGGWAAVLGRAIATFTLVNFDLVCEFLRDTSASLATETSRPRTTQPTSGGLPCCPTEKGWHNNHHYRPQSARDWH